MIYMTKEKQQAIIDKATEELSPETAVGISDILYNILENLDIHEKNSIIKTKNVELSKQYFRDVLNAMAKFTPKIDLDGFNLKSDRSKINEFLDENNFVFPLLKEGKEKAQRYFGDVEVSLNLREDYETDEMCLYLLIDSNRDVEEDVKSLHLLISEWWNDVKHKAKDKLRIDLEF